MGTLSGSEYHIKMRKGGGDSLSVPASTKPGLTDTTPNPRPLPTPWVSPKRPQAEFVPQLIGRLSRFLSV
jgi:hypothetical protein